MLAETTPSGGTGDAAQPAEQSQQIELSPGQIADGIAAAMLGAPPVLAAVVATKKNRKPPKTAPAEPLEKFYGQVCDPIEQSEFTTFVNSLEGKTIDQLLDIAAEHSADVLQSMRRTALSAWKLGAVLTFVKPHYKGDWIKWHRSIGLVTTSVDRYMRLFKAIKKPERLGTMLLSEAERVFKVPAAKKRKSNPPPPPPAPPKIDEALEFAGKALAALRSPELGEVDQAKLVQVKDLAELLLARIGELSK